MKILWILIALCIGMTSGCVGGFAEEAQTTRAVFAWQGVEDADLQLLEKYDINTIYMDMYHYSKPEGYRVYYLAGAPSWGLKDMKKAVKDAKKKKADGILFDIEGDYEALAKNLEKLESSIPVYVCIPFWLDEAVQKRIIKASDGCVIMNYLKGREQKNLQEEMSMAKKYEKELITAYELQPVGSHGLKEANTYHPDGLAAVEANYEEQFAGTDVGIAFHHLKMLRELDP